VAPPRATGVPPGCEAGGVSSDGRSSELWSRAAGLVLVLLLTVLLAVWGAFLVPLRLGGVPVPLGVLLALATLPLCRAGGWALGSRLGAALPGAVWLVVGATLGTRRSEGDLVVTGGALGLAFLVLGTLGAAVGAGTWRPSRPAAAADPAASRSGR